MSSIIETHQLSKTFGSLHAVQDLSFSIRPGDIYGLLGQNGAGKSTTMRLLLGLIRPDSGTVFIKGVPFNNRQRHLLRHIGAIIERPDLYGYLSGWDNLRLFASLSGKKITDASLHRLLGLVQLQGRERDKVKNYSQGMKQRLGIAIALAHDPELLILDEPTNGLDPQGIAEMRRLILDLSREHGKTILISSHLLYEIEQMATRMIILHQGRKIVEGPVTELLDPRETLVEVSVQPREDLVQLLQQAPWQQGLNISLPGQFNLKMHPGEVPKLTRWLVAQDLQVLEIRARHSLEAYFLSLTHEAATAH